MADLKSCRRFALTSAALLVVVAILVAAGVIPSVKVDTHSAAAPGSAVPAFWVNVVSNILIAAVLGLLALRVRGRSRLTTVVLGLLAFIVLLLAIALIDAASAYGSHGPGMRTATTLLFLGSALDGLAAILIVVTAIRCPKSAQRGPTST